MTKKERKVVFILIGVFLIVMIGTILITSRNKNKELNSQNEVNQIEEEKEKYTEKLSDGTKINNSSEFNETKKYNNLEITDIQFTSKDGNSVLLANIKNIGTTTHKIEIVKITILGENGEEITTLEPVIEEIEPGETEQLNAIVTADVANAKDFKIEAK